MVDLFDSTHFIESENKQIYKIDLENNEMKIRMDLNMKLPIRIDILQMALINSDVQLLTTLLPEGYSHIHLNKFDEVFENKIIKYYIIFKEGELETKGKFPKMSLVIFSIFRILRLFLIVKFPGLVFIKDSFTEANKKGIL